MTNEQWIVYLYSIWGNGGYSFVFWMILSVSTIFYIVYGSVMETKNADGVLLLKRTRQVIIVSSILGIISAVLPNKKGFLMIVGTPYVVDSIEKQDGKLNNLNEIVDLSLEKALKELKKENKDEN